MRRQQHNRRTQQEAYAPRSPRREGSTLMIVIALLAMLSLVGVVFYTFAAQERSNAEYFAATPPGNAGLPVSVYWDWALEQLIVGPDDSLQQSALWGGTHSMVPNMFGRDAHPFSGAGVNLTIDANGDPAVDQNYDGSPDGNDELLEFNVSPAARGTQLDLVARFPRDIDVDYTYPDINNLFISYDSLALSTGGGPRWRRVIIPSFHRPQYLRSGGGPIAEWYNSSATVTRVLRPHPDHVNVADGSPRYLGADAAVGGTGANADFPFVPADGNSNLQFGEMGVWTNSADTDYELDVDNDGDGIKEGVWLDLNFPVQKLADGTEYIPLFSYTVKDADSLLNVNVHGNSPKIDDVVIDGSRFGGNELISRSNQGIDPGEVNLQYAFYASATPNSWHFSGDATALSAALAPYSQFYNRDFTADPTDRQELSNMEYFFLTRGRPQFSGSGDTQDDVTDLFPGRYGELALLLNWIRQNPGATMLAGNFPKPGITGSNDQGAADPATVQPLPYFVHPLAYNGLGSYWNSAAYRQLDLAQPFALNPSVWLRYTDYQLKSTSTPEWGVNLLAAGANSDLLQWLSGNVHRGAEVDDAMESIFEQDFLQSSDTLFGPDETAYAQLSQSDRDTINITSRLERLMPFSQGAVDIRSKRAASQRLTAQSWDRKQFGYPRQFPGTQREWEMNRNVGDVNGDGVNRFAFPPSFKPSDWDTNPVPLGAWNTGTSAAVINDEPFRDELARLLMVINGSTQRGQPQFRLSLNQLLYSSGGGLAYRQLTDPAVNPVQAQLDRQLMARDIYVLLYTLGGGRDNANYADTNDHSNTMTTASGDFVYTPAQLRQMAQFAVNLVDAMDRDRVITKFEYDKNLGATRDRDTGDILHAGWNLDDDPRTNDGFAPLTSDDPGYDANYPEDSIERGVVYGVEAQLLTLSEALWVRVPQDPSHNSNITLYNEMTDKHEHLFIELRNASPFTVPLADGTLSTTPNAGVWRMTLRFADTTLNRTVTFLRNAGQVAAGGQYTIGASNGRDLFPDASGEHRPADLRIDYDLNGSFDLIVPALGGDSPPQQDTPASNFPNPRTDLDLVHKRDEVQKFAIGSSVTPQKGILLDGIDVSVQGFTLVLERRADLDRPGLDLDQNPWIEVDRMLVRAKPLPVNAMTETNIQPHLANIRSSERRQPFARGSGTDGADSEPEFNATDASTPPPPAPSGDSIRYNTIGLSRNSRSPSQFSLWQQHFDRDFASVGELLAVPLYGPQDVTRFAGGSYDATQAIANLWRHRPPLQEFSARTPTDYPLTAASLMLQPQHPGNMIAATPDPQLDNRWYRLLEFVEVPTRAHRHPIAGLDKPRVPGRLQLNMMRNPESLAGLIDDSNVADLDVDYMENPTNGTSIRLRDGLEPTARDWWEQWLRARDRLDPVTGMYLPGTASSRPFRSLSYLARGNESVEHTLLRQLPNDEGSTGLNSINRRLLEIGNSPEHQAGSVDPYIRHRLLSKAWGNTTNRSHMFVVFMSVDFFRASTIDPSTGNPLPDGVVRVGNRLDDTTVEHRGVFVVNRSRIEEADVGTNNDVQIDWRKLVDFRQTIK